MLGNLVVKLGLNSKGFTKGLQQSQQRLGMFSKKVVGGAIKLGAVAGTALAGALTGAVVQFAKYGDMLDKMSQRTGFTTNALSELGFAAEQSGTDIETLEKGIKGMQMQILNAERGLSTATDSLADLGLTVGDLEGLSPEDQFMKLAGAVADVQDPSKKAALALSIFGRAGQKLLPLLSAGSGAIEDLRQQARDLGISMSPEDAKAAAEFTDTWNSFKKVLMGIVYTVGGAVVPAFTSGLNYIIGKVKDAREYFSGFGPIFTQLKNVASAWFGFVLNNWKMVGQSFSTAFAYIGKVASDIFGTLDSLMGGMAEKAGVSFSSFTNVAMAALVAAEYGFKNWDKVAGIVITGSMLKAVGLFGEITHFFTGVIPAVLSGFSDNWTNTFYTGIDYVLTLFINLGDNIRSIMKATWDYVSSGGTKAFAPDLKKLSEGFHNSMKEIKIPDRIKSDFEKSLESQFKNLSGEVQTEYKDLLKERMALFDMGTKKKEESKQKSLGDPAAAGKADKKKSGGDTGAKVRGSVEAFSAIINSKRIYDKKIADNTKKLQDIASQQLIALNELVDQKPEMPPVVDLGAYA